MQFCSWMCNSDKTTVCQQRLRDANLSMNIECLIEANFCPIQWLTPLVSTWLINSCRHLSSCFSPPANLTCPVAALKHSPSKRTKSVKSKPSNASGQASGASGSGQDSGAPPSKEGKTLHHHSRDSWISPCHSVTRHPPSRHGVQVRLIADEISGMAKGSPESTESAAAASPTPPPQCVLPAVLRDRPGAGRPGRGAPPPVPPRSPRRPAEGSSSSSTCRGGQRVLAVDL